MTTNTILLLLTHQGNQRLLREMLAVHYEVVLARDKSALLEHFDLAILDGLALRRLQAQIRARKAAEQPVFLPFLLLMPQQEASVLGRELWQTVDELILTPVHRMELEGRVASLLKVRKDSLDLKHRNEELETLIYDLSETFESATEESQLARILVARAQAATRTCCGTVVTLEADAIQTLATTEEGTTPALADVLSAASVQAVKNALRSGPLTGAEARVVLGSKAGADGLVIAPITIKREPVAALCLQKADGASFSPGEIRIIESMSIQAGVFLHNLRQAHRLVDMAHLQEQVEVAETIQRQLLPASNVRVPGLDTAALYFATHQIGGDYYDVFPLGPHTVAAVIADVSGHSIASGLLMTAARSATRLLLRTPGRPAAILRQLNETLYRDLDQTGLFISLALLVLDMTTGLVRFANAGHNPPLWYRHTSAEVRTLDATGLLLGILPDSTYDEEEFVAIPGDACVLYTDGITEAQGERGTMFGEERLQSLVQRTGHRAASDIAQAIQQEVHTHAHGHLADDVTVLVLKFLASHGGSSSIGSS